MKKSIKMLAAIILMIGLSLSFGTLLNLMFSLCFDIKFIELQNSVIWVLYFITSFVVILASIDTEYMDVQ